MSNNCRINNQKQSFFQALVNFHFYYHTHMCYRYLLRHNSPIHGDATRDVLRLTIYVVEIEEKHDI